MRRPLVVAAEALLALAVTWSVGWVVAKVGIKSNAKANADVRASYAQERIAAALEKLAARKEVVKCIP